MAVNSTTNVTRLTANGTTGPFPFTFRIDNATDLQVVVRNSATGVETTQVLNTDYTIPPASIGDPNGGDVNFVAGKQPASGNLLTLRRVVQPTQDVDYTPSGPFPAETHERALDKLTFLAQQLSEELDRALKIPVSSRSTNVDLPDPSLPANQGKHLRISATGTAIEAVEVSEAFQADLLTTKGDLLGRSATATGRIPAGADHTFLKYDSSQAFGVTPADAHALATLNGPAVKSVVGSNLTLTLLELMGGIYNGSLAASVANNALTVALKTKAGNDPSPASPVFIAFRSSAAGNGSFVVRQVTGPLALTVSAGSTLGTQNETPHRLYVYLIDNAGVVELAIYNPYQSTGSGFIRRQPDWGLATTAAEGGLGGADSAQVLYSGTARMNVPIALLGYLESTQTTAGTWASAPSVVQTVYPGMPRTGDIVQHNTASRTTSMTTTAVIPYDNTLPQNTEGAQTLTVSITPSSVVNLLSIEHLGLYDTNATDNVTVALFDTQSANALTATGIHMPSGYNDVLVLKYQTIASTTAQKTYELRAGPNAGTTTLYINTDSVVPLYNGVLQYSLSVREIWV